MTDNGQDVEQWVCVELYVAENVARSPLGELPDLAWKRHSSARVEYDTRQCMVWAEGSTTARLFCLVCTRMKGSQQVEQKVQYFIGGGWLICLRWNDEFELETSEGNS